MTSGPKNVCMCVFEAADSGSVTGKEREREGGGGYREKKAFPFSTGDSVRNARARSSERTLKVSVASSFITTLTSSYSHSSFDSFR